MTPLSQLQTRATSSLGSSRFQILGMILGATSATCKRTQLLPTLLAQQCWKLLRPFPRSLTFDSGFKRCATTANNMHHGVQTDATCNIQQCCVRLQGSLFVKFKMR